MMEHFAKIVKPLTIFAKCSIIDVRLGSNYLSDTVIDNANISITVTQILYIDFQLILLSKYLSLVKKSTFVEFLFKLSSERIDDH